MRITNDMYSINRIKRAERHAERCSGRRAASLWIACKIWRGVWGPMFPGKYYMR